MEIKITLTDSPRQKPADQSKLGFGNYYTDHMFLMNYDEGQGWHDARIVPYGPISLDPAAMCLHYGQEVFEGLKAYRCADGKIQLFRPDKNMARLNVSNERLTEFSGTIRWRVRKNDSTIISHGHMDVTVPPMTSANVLALTPELTKLTEKMYRSHYIEYALVNNNTVVSSGTLMLVLPKQFSFLDPEISVNVDQIGEMYRFELSSKNFAKGVCLDFDEYDCTFGDNWFDLHGQKYSVLTNRMNFPPMVTPEVLKEKLKITSYYDII